MNVTFISSDMVPFQDKTILWDEFSGVLFATVYGQCHSWIKFMAVTNIYDAVVD